MVKAMGDSLQKHENLRVKVLLDWCRGTRMVKGESSSSLLVQLKRTADERCQMSFYHTPYLRGWVKSVLSSKWNETVGLQHCKV